MIIDSDEGVYSLALGLLYVLRDEEPYRNLSRLAFFLDRNSFDSLVDNLGGMTVTIPTREEVNSMLKALVYYQIRYLENKSFSEACRLSGANLKDINKINSYSKKIKVFFDNLNENALKKNSDSTKFKIIDKEGEE